jgi:Glycosyl hydrolase family 76
MKSFQDRWKYQTIPAAQTRTSAAFVSVQVPAERGKRVESRGRARAVNKGAIRCGRVLGKQYLLVAAALKLIFCSAFGAEPPNRFDSQNTVMYSPIVAGYSQFLRDFMYHYWDPEKHRIRPTIGHGYIDNNAAKPTFWHMAQAAHILYWHWKITHDPATQTMLQLQWREVRSIFTPVQMQSADPRINRGIVNVSDDAAWVMRYLVQVNEITGDPDALTYAENLFASTQTYFADPNKSGCGLLYATPIGDPTHQKQSSLYETVLAQSALYLYQKTGIDAYFTYAQEVWNWVHTCAAHPYGIFFEGADLDPQHPCYKRGIQCHEPGNITRGASVSYIGGVMGVECLSAELYLTTGEVKYLEDIKSVLPAMLQSRTFLRPASNTGVPGLTGNLLLNDRDAWTDGTYAESFAYNVLALTDVDANGEFKSVFRDTARAIIAQRTSDGYYSPDWSGPDAASDNPKWTSWAIQGLVTNPAINITGSISGTTLNVEAVRGATGTINVGQIVQGAGVAAGTQIVAQTSGREATGKYTVSPSQSVGTEAMAIGGNTDDYCCNYFSEANQIMTFSSDGGIIQGAAMLALGIHVILPLQ